jgi:hypothetical protein
MTMPITTMDEDDFSEFWKYEVGLAGKVGDM